jgi:large repetitive protein
MSGRVNWTRWTAAAATTSVLAAGLSVLVTPPLPAEAATGLSCPAGSQPFDFFWQRAAGGGAVWPSPYANSTVTNTGYSQSYPVGASGVSLTATITDPQNRNEDGDSPLVPNSTTINNWDGPLYTKTNGAYGADYLTAVMGSANSSETVTFEFSFTKPVLIPQFDIGDVDFTGQNSPPNDPLHDSFQDEVELFAERGGIPVGFTFTQGSPGTNQPTITGPNRVAGGPFSPAVNGNLAPTDPKGTVYLAANAPVTSFGLNYSNGPDDQANDPPAPTGIASVPAGSKGVSNNHAIRVSSFTVCVGTLSIGDNVYADLDGDGGRDPGEPGIPGVIIDIKDPTGNVIGTTTTDANGNYSLTQLPPNLVYTVDPREPTLPGGTTWTSTQDRDSTPNGVTAVDFTQPNPTSVTNADFGYRPEPSSISGRVVADPDNNGVFGGNDTPIAGVTVELLNSTGVVIATTTTDANGNYSFPNLGPGAYTVRETQPTGFGDGIDRPGTLGATSPSNDRFSVTLGYGQNSVNNDFYEIPQASLAGSVFVDADNDGVQDAGEAPIPGTTVTLTGTDEAGNAVTRTATTDANGNYSFTGLRAGSYTVTETQPAGFLDGKDSRPANPGGTLGNDVVSAITLGRTTAAVDYDFGEIQPATISGNVSATTTTPGPIAGVTITLTGTDDLGNPVNVTTTTDASGNYSFPNLRPGTYTVTETQPTGYGEGGQTSPDSGAVTTTTNVISNIVLTSGEVNPNNNFTETRSSISGSVYVDSNDDGVRDAGETGIPFAEVRLYLAGSQTLVATTFTDANGNYTFGNLLEDRYRIEETQPPAYFDGKDAVGSVGGTANNDILRAIDLPAGTAATGYNFGELQGTSISGRVTDENGDPIAGVTMTLRDSGGNVVATTTTDATGAYAFTALVPGTYSVTETQPTGFGEGSTTPGSAGGTAAGNVISGIVLTSGTAGVSYDFVETYSSLAGTVFVDTDNDGVQDAGENGIPGVTVTLTGTDAAGNTVNRTATTDANGDYLFDDLLAGTAYTVTETQPTAYLDGIDTAGTSGGATTVNDRISAINLPAGTDATSYDFGEISPASIAGRVLDDKPTPNPIPGVTITLTGTDDLGNPVSLTTTTNASGNYSFTGLRPGTYTVTETQPAGYGTVGQTSLDGAAVTSTSNVISNIVLSPNESNVANNFIETYSSLAGTVFVDTDNDGVQDAGENGIPGVTVTLTGTDAAGNTVNRTATTDANGDYLFDDLLAGTAYTVTETQPTAYLDGIDTAGTSGGATTVNDRISAINLPAGTDATSYDFGEITAASIAGRVVDDVARGIPGVTITLTGTDDLGNTVNVVTTTNASGNYSFTGLRPGTYTVTETQPTAYGDGGQVAGTSGGTVTNDQMSDQVSAIVLTPGTNATGYDFDETTGSIAGTVYEDVNGLGSRDPGEPGIAGVTVELLDNAGNVVATTTTDANGDYLFDNLPGATYRIRETQPAAYGDADETVGSVLGSAATNDLFTGVALPGGVDATGYDFGEDRGSISGVVFLDYDDDGLYEPGNPTADAGLPGVTVTLTGIDANGNNVSRTTTTAANGSYTFDNLLAGTYTVTETQPAGVVDGKDTVGSTGGVLSPDSIGFVTLDGGEDAVDYWFGEIPPAGVQGQVRDVDGLPIPGVTIELLNSAGVVIGTTTTSAAGTYSFGNLPAGTYGVREVQPAGLGESATLPGSNGGTAAGNTITGIVLGALDVATDYDFVERYSSLAGTVYVDRNGNGAQDAGEPGIPGVTVELAGTDAAGNSVLLSAETDANGDYVFERLVGGTYTVTETQPTAYLDGEDAAGSVGGNDAVNDVISAISLPGGVAAVNYDFGEYIGATVSGRVLDNKPTPNPIAGVTLTLTGTDDFGNPVSLTTTTDASGNYFFENLRPGVYTVTETQPAGYGTVGQNSLDPAAVTTASNVISNLVLSPGESNVANNFIERYSSIAGSVYEDVDGDGVQDTGEPGIPGATVTLTGTDAAGNTVNRTATTDANGNYLFDDLLAGTAYTVTETQPAGYLDGIDTAGTAGGNATVNDRISSINLPAGTDATDYDFGEVRAATISGTVTDDNGNPIPGVTITLTGPNGTTTATTDANGNYSFTGLAPGAYTVTETQPAGFGEGGQTSPDTGAVTTTTNVISNIVLSSGETNPNNNFVETYSSIAGSVYVDVDNDGVRDAGEPGLVTTVTLTGTDANGDPVTRTTTTDTNGNYLFDDLLSGAYVVTETQPPRYADGQDTVGSVGGTLTNDTVSAITLPTGTAATGYNFGEVGTTLSGTVWVDRDRDGVIDADEASRLGGVTMTLLDTAGNVVATTTTAADGTYSFVGIPAGDYVVRQTQPGGYGSSTPNELPVTVPVTGLTGVNFGETLGTIGDFVWADANGNGVQEPGETGVAGVTVRLLDSTGNLVAATTTAANGSYKFVDVPFGAYTVEFVPPTGQALTRPGQGTAANGSDPDWITGRTGPVTVNADLLDVTDVDAGLVVPVIDLAITGAVSPTLVSIGERVTFTFNSTNNSNVPVADGVKVVITLPPGVRNPIVTAPGFACTVSGQTVTCVRSSPSFPGEVLPQIAVSAVVASGVGSLQASATIGTINGNPETTFANNQTVLRVQLRAGSLPRTGGSPLDALLTASGLIVVGMGIRRLRRRPRVTA